MEVRGVRECKECGTQWSYFETGSTACPECGSMHSVGIEERKLHTDRPVDLDLSEATTLAAEDSTRDSAEVAADAAMGYIKSRGFIHAGELAPLDDQYVSVHELRHVASEIARRLSLSEDEEYYYGAVLEAATEGTRVDAEAVPQSMESARGLSAAAAVRAYRDDLRTWIDHEPTVQEARSVLESLGSHVRRVRALDGSVPTAESDRLVTAAKALGEFLRTDDEDALERARAALDALS